MDATCKIQDGIHMPRIIKKCVQDSGYISPRTTRVEGLIFSKLQAAPNTRNKHCQSTTAHYNQGQTLEKMLIEAEEELFAQIDA